MNGQVRAAHRPSGPGGGIRLALIGIVALGCGSGCWGNRVAAVDAVGARQALRSTLEGWKRGDPIDSMKGQSPSIVAQDLDWEAGHQLIGFDVLGEGKDEAVNLRIPVALTLRDKGGAEIKKKVQYIVGTSPVITVFREIF